MKVLYVVSGNKNQISPFIQSQCNSLSNYLDDSKKFAIKGKGIFGYLKNIFRYKSCIKNFKPDVIHAHYGLSGLFANLQRKVPVVVTYHGSDVNVKKNIKWSYLTTILATNNIFVHPDLPDRLNFKKKPYNIIPCGVNLDKHFNLNKNDCRDRLGLKKDQIYILFSSSFDNPVKNYPLAKQVIDKFDRKVKLIELKGYTVKEVNLLMNAVDALLVTSFSETGPLVVKEAMSCNLPIVSTDVGDVRWVTGDMKGHFVSTFKPNDLYNNLLEAIEFSKSNSSTNGRERLIKLDLDSTMVAEKIARVYRETKK